MEHVDDDIGLKCRRQARIAVAANLRRCRKEKGGSANPLTTSTLEMLKELRRLWGEAARQCRRQERIAVAAKLRSCRKEKGGPVILLRASTLEILEPRRHWEGDESVPQDVKLPPEDMWEQPWERGRSRQSGPGSDSQWRSTSHCVTERWTDVNNFNRLEARRLGKAFPKY